jgi:hypothetical protein
MSWTGARSLRGVDPYNNPRVDDPSVENRRSDHQGTGRGTLDRQNADGVNLASLKTDEEIRHRAREHGEGTLVCVVVSQEYDFGDARPSDDQQSWSSQLQRR